MGAIEWVIRMWYRYMSLFERISDSPEQRTRKRVLATSIVFMPLTLVGAVHNVQDDETGYVTMLPQGLSCLLFVAQIIISRTAMGWTNTACYIILACWAAFAVMMDLRALTGFRPIRAWPFLILIIDSILLFRLPERCLTLFTICCVLYFVLISLEHKLRFGLFDMPGLPSYESRQRLMCSCDKPPCADATTWDRLPMYTSLVVFVVDVYMTRMFARNAHTRGEQLKGTVDAAIAVASHLSTFHLDGAAHELMRRRDDMPDDLRDAFINILADLRSYRAFLPRSTFYELDRNPLEAPQRARAESPASSDIGIFENVSLAQLDLYPAPQVKCCVATKTNSFQDAMPAGSSGNVQHHFRTTRATLLVLSQGYPADTPNVFVPEHAAVLEHAMTRSNDNRGVLDFVMADRFYMSFNASLPCPSHSRSALQTLFGVKADVRMPLRGAVATGAVTCATLGNETFKCFGVMGDLPLLADGILRFCHEFNVSTLTHAVETEGYAMRALARTVVLERRRSSEAGAYGIEGEQNIVLWEVICTEENEEAARGMESSLTTLNPKGLGRSEQWEHYNSAVRTALSGRVAQAERRMRQEEPDDQILARFLKELSLVEMRHRIVL